MSKLIPFLIAALLVATGAMAQQTVSGSVSEKDGGRPIAGANVMIKTAEGKIVK